MTSVSGVTVPNSLRRSSELSWVHGKSLNQHAPGERLRRSRSHLAYRCPGCRLPPRERRWHRNHANFGADPRGLLTRCVRFAPASHPANGNTRYRRARYGFGRAGFAPAGLRQEVSLSHHRSPSPALFPARSLAGPGTELAKRGRSAWRRPIGMSRSRAVGVPTQSEETAIANAGPAQLVPLCSAIRAAPSGRCQRASGLSMPAAGVAREIQGPARSRRCDHEFGFLKAVVGCRRRSLRVSVVSGPSRSLRLGHYWDSRS